MRMTEESLAAFVKQFPNYLAASSSKLTVLHIVISDLLYGIGKKAQQFVG